jgi:hypothetical protein
MNARLMFSTSAKNQLMRPNMGLGVFKENQKPAFGRSSPNKGAYVLGGHEHDPRQVGKESP